MNEKEQEKKKSEEFLARYVKPHDKKSRLVTEDDLSYVLKESHVLFNLCFSGNGKYPSGFAVAHPQIEDKDPLQLFVTQDKRIIINPKIIKHTNHTVDSLEGCLSYPDKEMIIVQRWNKCEIEYYTVERDGEKLIKKTENLSGKESKVFQHECQHLGISPYDKLYIYDE